MSQRIDEGSARKLWQRAAALQAAAERATVSRALTQPSKDSLSLDEVAAVAQSAGIDADCVRLAFAEQQLPDAHEIRPDQSALKWLRPVVGGDVEAIEVVRTIHAPPADVLEAIRVVFAEPTYALVPELVTGADPLTDGVLVYRSTKRSEAQHFYDSLNWADGRVLLVMVRAEGEHTRVRIRVPLFRRGFNVGLLAMFGSMGGYGGGVAGWAIGASVLGVAAPVAVLAMPAVIGTAAGAVAVGTGFRSLYWWATNGGRSAVLSLLNAVALRVEARTARIVAPPANVADRTLAAGG